MKLINLSMFVLLSLLVACGSPASPETAEPEDQPTPPSVAPAIKPTTEIAPDDQRSPLATPAEKVVETLQTSPLGTAVSQSAPLENDAEPGGRKADFPNTIIVYRREGRFPGSPKQWTFYHTGRIVDADGIEWRVPAAKVKPLFDFAGGQTLWKLSETYAPAGQCLDCLVQILTIYREGEVKEISITQTPPDLPQDLGQVLEDVSRLVSE